MWFMWAYSLQIILFYSKHIHQKKKAKIKNGTTFYISKKVPISCFNYARQIIIHILHNPE